MSTQYLHIPLPGPGSLLMVSLKIPGNSGATDVMRKIVSVIEGNKQEEKLAQSELGFQVQENSKP